LRLKKKKIIFWGGTGQAIMLEESLRNNYELITIFDNDKSVKSPFKNVPIYYEWNGFLNWYRENENIEFFYAVAIGGANGKSRCNIHNKLKKYGLTPVNVVHKTAYVSEDASINEGCQILPQSSINARVKLGESCIVNTSASIDHESIIGDGVHIGPGAKLAGCIEIGDYSFIGTNATILPNIKIGSNVIIGAGSVVTKNIPDNSIAYGNPCKIIEKS
jgi:sugar O-acyltransferase (sialic acid O-acetyltransferase NeuD family)